jgi:hypothetical protein
MGYTEDSSYVRVDIFKESGKFYTTISLKWDRFNAKDKNGKFENIHDTFRRCLEKETGSWKGMWAVCLEPYHENSHPLMMKM